MRHLLTLLAALLLCSAPLHAQTLKSLMYNSTNGQVVANTGTNVLTFTNTVQITTLTNVGGGIFTGDMNYANNGISGYDGNEINFEEGTIFGHWTIYGSLSFDNTTNAATTRANLGLGASNTVTLAGLTNNGDITINGTTATNGLLYIRRTNTEAFLGMANLIASNNTTVSNETLFRVGVAELTNKSAQFGFRSTNTHGNGVAVFSVLGFNALMQIGADASTNAVVYSGGGTNNEVMTLIRDGATEFARPLRFSTNAASKPATNAPANTTNVAAWVEMRIGTNSYRVPLYQ